MRRPMEPSMTDEMPNIVYSELGGHFNVMARLIPRCEVASIVPGV